MTQAKYRNPAGLTADNISMLEKVTQTVRKQDVEIGDRLLCYTRGAPQDGGWFHEYLKSFPGLGIEVHIGFSGNGLPEENRTVALTTMTFERKSQDGESNARRRGVNNPLKDLPAVLLAECVGDLRALAAAGNGFEADWEKKVY